MIVKDIFDGNFNDDVHVALMRYSRGDFADKFLIDAKKTAKAWNVKTGFEYVNGIVRRCLESLGDTEVKVTGAIVSTLDLASEARFPIEKVSNFQGVKTLKLNDTIHPSGILALMDKYPRAFFALSFSTDDFLLKVKAKGPKPPKGGNKDDEEKKADFLTIKTANASLISDLFFDTGLDFKVASINHTLHINNIVYPENMTTMKPAEVREQAKRGGILERKTTLDGASTITDANFTA